MAFLLNFRGQSDQGAAGLLSSASSSSDLQPQPQSQTTTSHDRGAVSKEQGENTTSATNKTITATPSSPARREEDHQSPQATDADDERDINENSDSNYFYDTDNEMASGAGGKRGPLPKIIPALPLVPLPARRKDSSSGLRAPLPPPPPQQQQDFCDLSDGFSQMQLGGKVCPVEKLQESVSTAGVPKVAQPSLQVITNGSTPAAAIKKNVTLDVKGKGKELFIPPEENAGQEDSVMEVVRSNPVAIVHQVSQTSNLKEIKTVKNNTPTVGVTGIATVIRAPDPEETPEQAAERKRHSGFMRDALDMVCG